MKVAIVGSRSILLENIGEYLPPQTSEIISGGAKGIDSCAANYAKANGLKLTEFLPEYSRYGRAAPLKRNDKIIEAADLVIIFWNGNSKGSKYVINKCKKSRKPHVVHIIEP